MAEFPGYLVQSNRPINGEHWGLMFKAGAATTDNAALAEKLKRKGYAVTRVEFDAGKAPAPVETNDDVTADMSVAELREIGKQHGLTFKVGLTKQAMADAINKAGA